jgi:cytochrome c-type biogenesis protein CcmH
MRWNRLRLLSGLLLGVCLLGAGDDSARVERLGHQMMCMCGCNQILLECNHVGCTYSDRMRGELTAAIDAGKGDQQVLQYFIEKYGTTVLAAPTRSGFDRIAWITPYVALLIGIGGVLFVLGVWHRRLAARPVSAEAELSAAELNRFREQARRETDL